MKIQQLFIAFSFLLASTCLFTACNQSSSSSENKTEEVDKSGKEYTSAYVCPMHCVGSGSNAAGNCPVCGMAYVANENHQSDGHDHSDGDNSAQPVPHDHDGDGHPDH